MRFFWTMWYSTVSIPKELLPADLLFYAQLQERVAGKQMEAAILETNYWCAEEATYQATDDRTISAEAVYRNGIGRAEKSRYLR